MQKSSTDLVLDRVMSSPPSTYRRILLVLTAILIVKVTAAVVWNYRNYLPPDFNAAFLRGRQSYFFDGYHLAFYAHIAAGPATLLTGLLLVSDRFRTWRPVWHRHLGRIQGVTVLLIVAPSGLWMAFYAMSGPIAGASFATLAIATATCVVLGWRSAVKRHFVVHRRWMMRTFLLLCSAVTLRLAGGAATVVGVQSAWFDPIAAWACWVVPLAIYEGAAWRKRRRASAGVRRQSASSTILSPASAEISALR